LLCQAQCDCFVILSWLVTAWPSCRYDCNLLWADSDSWGPSKSLHKRWKHRRMVSRNACRVCRCWLSVSLPKETALKGMSCGCLVLCNKPIVGVFWSYLKKVLHFELHVY
jgi:hypothetical protein